jgi:hypothetical protein
MRACEAYRLWTARGLAYDVAVPVFGPLVDVGVAATRTFPSRRTAP